MPAATSPIKVDDQTDKLISDAAHFLGRSKKDIVDAAMREYIESHRDELNAAVRQSLARLDGSDLAAVALLSGLSDQRISDVGGVPAN